MRFFSFALALAVGTLLIAQENDQKKGPNPFAGPFKNLKMLKPEQVRPLMLATRAELGVNCMHCHVAGDWASDANPKKDKARMMAGLMEEINAKFGDNKMHVTCYTCHRGEITPKTEPPAAEAGGAQPAPVR